MRIDDVTFQKLKRDYCNPDREETNEDLARRYGVSRATLARYAKDNNWQPTKMMAAAVDAMVTQPERVKAVMRGKTIDVDALRETMINDLQGEMASVPGKSKESIARAIGELLRDYERRNPMTMEELADLAMSIPNFEPIAFARILKERYVKAG